MHAPPRARPPLAATPVPPVPRILGALLTLLIAASSTPGLDAADWPRFLGPARNGSSPDAITTTWPADGPAITWSRQVGSGFSGPIVAGHRLLLHQRRGDEEILECLDAGRGGDPLWRHAEPTTYRDDFGFDNGPRATPAVSGDRIVTFGAAGLLCCVDLITGRRLWSVDTVKEFKARKGFFGFASSPLIDGGLVLLNPGGPDGAGIVAFNLTNGQVRWKATGHEAGYAAPVTATSGNQPLVLVLTREGLVALDPGNGNIHLEHRFRSRQHASVNAASPLVLGSRVFLTASYDTGATLLELQGKTATPVWSNDESLSSHYASVVHHDGTLFGFHGRQEYGPSLRAVDAGTGRVLWSREGLGGGTVTLAGANLLILTDSGELIAAPASRTAFRAEARAQILGSGTRAHPALADGFLFARDPKRMVCVNLRTPP